MLSFLRMLPPRTVTAAQSKIFYEDGRSFQEFHEPDSKYMMTHSLPPAKIKSFFAPPMHYHMYQTEYFEVFSGKGRWYLSGESKVYEKGEIVKIPVWQPHCFENADSDNELLVGIRLDPRDYVMEVRFFRNFFGYLEDCRKANMEPSIFQLLRFLYTVDGPLAVPIPGSALLSRWASWLLMFLGGRIIGGFLLGYEGTYPEYYKPRAN